MKGKHAAAAANRRANHAEDTARELRIAMDAAHAKHHQEVEELKTEIRKLRANHVAEASRIAAEEVTRRLAENEEERRKRGVSDEIVKGMLVGKDKFIRNACRYVSMTTGNPPSIALAMVAAWMTDEDFYGFDGPHLIIKFGVTPKGWVAAMIRSEMRWQRAESRRRKATESPLAMSLDRAEGEVPERIHPDYKPSWYPPVTYQELQLVDDETAA